MNAAKGGSGITPPSQILAWLLVAMVAGMGAVGVALLVLVAAHIIPLGG